MRRIAPVVAFLFGALMAPAFAQPAPQGVPRGAEPDTGARPGNEIGTGSSLPMSDKASNITSSDTQSTIAPNLPSPPIGENASPRDYLLAARAALAGARTGEAQQSLEMAETRALDRSVPLFQTNVPSKNPLIGEIQAALDALGRGDRMRAMQVIEAALPHAEQ